jgi:phosphatidate cytidylyltransferase
MLKQRLITVAQVLPLLLGLMFFAPNAVWSAVALIAVAIGAVEWSRLCRYARSTQWLFSAAVVLICAGLFAVFVAGYAPGIQSMLMELIAGVALLFWVLLVPAWLRFQWVVRNAALLAATGLVVLVPAWLAISLLQRVPLLLFLALGAVWIADTAAYFCGRRYGRHKLAPGISPGKTVEGLVGAFIAVLLYAFLVSWFFQRDAAPADHIALLAFAAVLTALSVAGDLFESWMKRLAGVKDSGRLLPGHGGMLDRIDSLTAAMPFAALYFYGMLA